MSEQSQDPVKSGESGFPVFDIEQALQVTGGDIGILRRVSEVFLKTLPERLREFAQAFSTGDMGEIKRLAHSAKGAGASVGAARLSKAAFDLESSAREGRQTDVERCYGILKDELVAFQRTLETLDWDRCRANQP